MGVGEVVGEGGKGKDRGGGRRRDIALYDPIHFKMSHQQTCRHIQTFTQLDVTAGIANLDSVHVLHQGREPMTPSIH